MMDLTTAGDRPAHDADAHGETDAGYLRIGEVARQFDVTLRTLRFYEDKGLISPKRDGNSRLYSRRDVTRLKLIMRGRKVGFSLRDVKQMLDLYDPSGSNTKQMRVALDKSQRQLSRLEKQKAALDDAIGDLNEGITALREQLATAQSSSARN